MSELLRGRDYIETSDFTNDELELLLETSAELKQKFKSGISHKTLEDKTIFLFFFDKSTRTRNSFEAGITQLGGHAHFIEAGSSQVAHGESPKDMGIILSSYGHSIAIRHDLFPGEGNTYIREVARWAEVPVINMQCDIDHPCQTLSDLMTLREHFGQDLRGKKLAISWAYAPSYAKPMSVPQGLITLMTRFGMDIVLAHPPEYKLIDSALKKAKSFADKYNSKFEVVDNMDAAFENADIVYPKSWGIEKLFQQPEEALAISARYKDWICNEKRMELANPEAIYMHCLPADRGNEVTDAVIDGPQSVVYQEAENRLHTCKAIMSLTM